MKTVVSSGIPYTATTDASGLVERQGAESAAIGTGEQQALNGPRNLQAATPAMMMLGMPAGSCVG
jgi:hypothetical protein